MWAGALNSIDPNIVITPVVANSSAPSDGQPIQIWPIGPFSPYPSYFTDYILQDPYAPGWLNSTGHPDEAAMYAQMNALITKADLATNTTLAAQEYKQIEQMGINLYLCIYLYQINEFYVVKPYLTPYQGQISLFMNPMDFDLYVWWVKTCGSTQACSGRGIGP
jgi:hypothetical protein